MKYVNIDIESIDFGVPADVVAAVLALGAFDLLLIGPSGGQPLLRALLGIVVVLFVPGYLLVAILFPVREAAGTETGLSFGDRTITWTERLGLAVATSLALLPLLGLAVVPLTGSLSEQSVLAGLHAVVLLGAVGAIHRRHRLPESKRFRVPFRAWARSLTRGLGGESRRGRVLSALLVVGLVGAVLTMGIALLSPAQAEQYTGVTLLTETDSGELVASEYPATLTDGEGHPMVLRVENNEGAATTYSVVVELQRMDTVGDATTITEERRLLDASETVPAGETWRFDHTVAPTMTGEDLRVTYHVYRGDPPAEPSVENDYRTVYFWTTVEAPA